MKIIKYIILLLIISCIGEGPFSKYAKFYGSWEITHYEINGNDVLDQAEIMTNRINIKNLSGNSYQIYASRNGGCNNYPISFGGSDKIASFSIQGFCDSANLIDPLYYKSSNSNNADTLGSWNIELHNRRILILNNHNYPRTNDIRIVFEKRKL